ncbi:MAG: hypothetical protein JWO60_2306, partial [Frankiales bacterium]|nr:hypothetical protein [Frankiales bacterium]
VAAVPVAVAAVPVPVAALPVPVAAALDHVHRREPSPAAAAGPGADAPRLADLVKQVQALRSEVAELRAEVQALRQG